MQDEEEYVEDNEDLEETEDPEDDEDVYKDKDVEVLGAEDELSEEEEGFMQGYNHAAEEKKHKQPEEDKE